MNEMIFKQQSIEEIIKKIEKKALSYTPEWRFDRENPDIGTVLSLVFANMIHGTYKKLNLVPYKNKTAFFNELDANLLPEKASWGYAAFSMVGKEAEGQEVPAGTKVVFPGGRGERINFETLNDLYAVGTQISSVIFAHGERDFIGEVYIGEGDEKRFKPFLGEGENLQEHILYFAGGRIFDLRSAGKISLKFLLGEGSLDMEEIGKALSLGDMVFEYSTGKGYREFKNTDCSQDGISFILGREDIPFEEQEERGYLSRWIRLRLKNRRLPEKFSFNKMLISSVSKKRRPEIIFSEGEEVLPDEFYPFGKRFTDYSEAYIASDEVFGKKGAQISISFYMEFERIPISETDVNEIQWEWIMKKSEIKPEPEYEILIEEAVWEYYNGKGWKRLCLKNEDVNFFPETGRETAVYSKTISFICPSDIEPILIDSKESYYIRLRITRVSNLFKLKGYFVSPIIKNLSLRYSYEAALAEPDFLFTVNNREFREFKQGIKNEGETVFPFYGIKEKNPSLYFGFDRPLRGGPIKIYFSLKEKKGSGRNLLWEYYNGQDWKALDLTDETEGLSRSGIITFLAYDGIKKKEIFGKEKCWLRVTDISQGEFFPCIQDIYMNSVKVRCISQGGEYTNIKEKNQGQLLNKLRFIKGVSNPERMMGGSDAESLKEAFKRNASYIRNQDMAITLRDFEEISRNASRSIHRVKCFSGYDENEERKSGVLTLLVLLKNYRNESREFYSVKLEIENCLKDRMNSSIRDLGQIFIRQPYFIELNVCTELAVDSMEAVFSVKKQTEKRLRDFLDPINGSFDNTGWEIGTLPDIMQLKNAISEIEGIKYINNLYVNFFLQKGRIRREVDPDRIRKSGYVLPVSGEHEIIINL